MNVEKEFEVFYWLLKTNSRNIYVNEMLDEIEKSEVLFHLPNKLDTKHLLKVYTDRFNIQKDVTKHDLVEGWEGTLNNLEKESDVNICIVSLTTSKASYTVFTSTSIDRMIGILKSRNNDLKKVYRERKLTTSSKRFNKRILQHD